MKIQEMALLWRLIRGRESVGGRRGKGGRKGATGLLMYANCSHSCRAVAKEYYSALAIQSRTRVSMLTFGIYSQHHTQNYYGGSAFYTKMKVLNVRSAL